MKIDRPTYEVVIPAHNESRSVARIVRETLQYVDRVIVVDDGSTDDTADQARAAGARVVGQIERGGYLRALAVGFAATAAPIVITLDADGEHDPADIPALVAPIEAGKADLVFGNPGKFVRWSERVLSWLAAHQTSVVNSATGYRAFEGDLARRIPLRGRCTCGILALDAHHLGARLAEVPVRLRPTGRRRTRAWFHLIQVWWVLRGVFGL